VSDERPLIADDDLYVESQIIMTTVRAIAPFSMTYGLFLTFHGGSSPGGGFQGGAIMGATVLMIAFAFGIAPTRDWLRNRTVVLLATGGVGAFALIGLLPLLSGKPFLTHKYYDGVFDAVGIAKGKKWALEGVEIVGIAPIVTAVIVGLFFLIASGFARVSVESAAEAESVRRDGGEQS